MAWGGGESAAAESLMDAVYGELCRLARAHVHHERRDHTIPAT